MRKLNALAHKFLDAVGMLLYTTCDHPNFLTRIGDKYETVHQHG